MESMHFLNIIFAYLPGGKLSGPGKSHFLCFPAEIFELSFNPQYISFPNIFLILDNSEIGQ